MKITILFLLITFLIVGCNHKKTISVNGETYTLVREGKTNANGITEIELWERSGITNRYYIRSLNGTIMQSIVR